MRLWYCDRDLMVVSEDFKFPEVRFCLGEPTLVDADISLESSNIFPFYLGVYVFPALRNRFRSNYDSALSRGRDRTL